MSKSWTQFSEESPDLAAAIRSRFESHLHHVIATVSASGAPRASGTEIRWWNDDAWLGSMPGSRKSADVMADPRFSIHSHPDSSELLEGDAKLAGTAGLVDDASIRRAYSEFVGHPGDDPYDLFRISISSASLVKVSDDKTHLVITAWSAAGGTKVIERT
ncbi:MAG: pyridoxamine 5'-phosphate oxidase family protein [Acidimicrobiia bacterium]|nr:pyridoxamine 5'-phosphate oxidase family protein [Acidimicrobiia bacterium]